MESVQDTDDTAVLCSVVEHEIGWWWWNEKENDHSRVAWSCKGASFSERKLCSCRMICSGLGIEPRTSKVVIVPYELTMKFKLGNSQMGHTMRSCWIELNWRHQLLTVTDDINWYRRRERRLSKHPQTLLNLEAWNSLTTGGVMWSSTNEKRAHLKKWKRNWEKGKKHSPCHACTFRLLEPKTIEICEPQWLLYVGWNIFHSLGTFVGIECQNVLICIHISCSVDKSNWNSFQTAHTWYMFGQCPPLAQCWLCVGVVVWCAWQCMSNHGFDNSSTGWSNRLVTFKQDWAFFTIVGKTAVSEPKAFYVPCFIRVVELCNLMLMERLCLKKKDGLTS